MLLELWAATDWSRFQLRRGMRDYIRASIFGDWCEKLLVLNDVPSTIRLPAIDFARLSFADIDLGALSHQHPLLTIRSDDAKTPEALAAALAKGSRWEERVPSLIRFARALAGIETALSDSGLPPLWPRIILSLGEEIALSPVAAPDEDHIAGELAALLETTDIDIKLAPSVLAPLDEIGVGGKIVVLSHFDPHGLSGLAPTVRTLRKAGFPVEAVSSYETTGDYARLWRRVVRRYYDDPATAAIVLTDLSIDSRHPERCREFAAEANQGSKPVIWIDHHRDTLMEAKNLAGRMVRLHLTSVLATNLAEKIDAREIEILAMGALGDKDPYSLWAMEEWRKAGKLQNLNDILAGVERSIDLVAPPGRILRKAVKEFDIDPFENVRERIIRSDSKFLARLGKESRKRPLTLVDIAAFPVEAMDELPELFDEWNAPSKGALIVSGAGSGQKRGDWEMRERVVVFNERPETAGRFWYSILERAMDECGSDSLGRLIAPYAVACRKLDRGRMNLLFLTHHNAPHAPDARLFLPQKYQQKWIGHSRAFWLDADEGKEKRLISLVAARINRFMNRAFPLVQ